jgi:iron complex transport system permease protein
VKIIGAVGLILFGGAVFLLQQGESGFDFFEYLVSGHYELSAAQQFVLFELRLPPVVAGVFAGLAFGLAGAIFQNQFRNPLASPDVLGVTSGASAAVLAASVFNLAIPVQVAAILGAIVIAVLVFLLGWGRGQELTKVVVTGLALGYLATGVTSYLLTRSDSHEVAASFAWLVGSTRMATTPGNLALVAVVGLASIFVGIAHRPTKAFELGQAKAETLGFTINRWTLSLLSVAVVLAAFATAAVGPISFVALLAGPIAVKLGAGRSNQFVLAALVGACLIVFSDLVLALLFKGQHLPTGLVTGLLGAVFLVTLIFRKQGRTSV